ncbi:hypothetical protein GE09DRAFT_1052700 [Coniochaeta sp. 2T2.1]|nr:hypothetical protein GE09DRAFT_1052700 [Coniochaeta sp. 2T2.1]
MTFKDHGYYGYAYIGARITQAITLLPIIGLVGNFLSLIAKSRHSPPSELTATIVFSSISLLWILLSITAYHDTHIPYLATLAVDSLFLLPFMVIAIVVGQPLSLTTCSDLPSNSTSHVALPISSLPGKPVSYVVFSGGAGQTTCYELMAVWGLVIALCCLFAISAIAAGFLFLGKRRATAYLRNDHQAGSRQDWRSPQQESHQVEGGYVHNSPQMMPHLEKGPVSEDDASSLSGGPAPSQHSQQRGSFDSGQGRPDNDRRSFDEQLNMPRQPQMVHQ